MSNEKLGADLSATEEATVVVKKERKVQTEQDRAVLVAGVEQMELVGVSDNFKKVLELVPDWNNTDKKDVVAAVKKAVIAKFGESSDLKNYIDTKFEAEFNGWLGISKVAIVLNAIKAFYASRPSTATPKVKKVPTIQVNIAGTPYNVSSAYYAEIADKTVEEKRELLLVHPNTAKAEIVEIL